MATETPRKISLAPVITITPASQLYLPTPPLTPDSASDPLDRASPVAITTPTSPARNGQTSLPFMCPSPSGGHQSMHYPLTKHLALMHPSSPKEVVHFVATRLLSPDRPHGHDGEWSPIWKEFGDLSNAGVGLDAGRGGCQRKAGGAGQEIDRKLEEMYGIARESYRLLELKLPDISKL